MAHVTQGDIEELWNSAPHNWSGLRQNLEGRLGTSQGISNNDVNFMIQIAKDMEQKHESFPNSDQQLYNVINSHLPNHRH